MTALQGYGGNEQFAWNFVVAPVPESGHLCSGSLPAQEMEELKQSCDAEVEDKVAEAAKENDKRLLKELQAISAKCTDTGDDEEDDRSGGTIRLCLTLWTCVGCSST